MDGVPLSVMRGRWLAARGLLATAIVVAACPEVRNDRRIF
jgi:hypothetical protein